MRFGGIAAGIDERTRGNARAGNPRSNEGKKRGFETNAGRGRNRTADTGIFKARWGLG